MQKLCSLNYMTTTRVIRNFIAKISSKINLDKVSLPLSKCLKFNFMLKQLSQTFHNKLYLQSLDKLIAENNKKVFV